MTRLVPIAGDGSLGQEAVSIIRRGSIAAEVPADARAQVWSMRQRLEASVHGRDHLKRGLGGYVDAEFIAQFLCLGLPCGSVPVGASIVDLLRLHKQNNRISAEDFEHLKDGMDVLRQMEARMRLYEGKAISSLPTEATKRGAFSRCAGYSSCDEMDLELHVAREQLRNIFERFFAQKLIKTASTLVQSRGCLVSFFRRGMVMSQLLAGFGQIGFFFGLVFEFSIEFFIK